MGLSKGGLKGAGLTLSPNFVLLLFLREGVGVWIWGLILILRDKIRCCELSMLILLTPIFLFQSFEKVEHMIEYK